MKKLFIVLTMIAFLFAGTAIAKPDWEYSDFFYHKDDVTKIQAFSKGQHPGNNSNWLPCTVDICGETPQATYAEANTSAKAVPFDFSESHSATGKGDWGNATAEGYVSGETAHSAFSEGEWKKTWRGEKYISPFAQSLSIVDAHFNGATTWSYAKDIGKESYAGAGGLIEADRCNVFVIGDAFGLNGAHETSQTTIGFGGVIFQDNRAYETRSVGYAEGFNESSLSFEATKTFGNSGQSWTLFGFPIPGAGTIGYEGISGNAYTKGSSFAKIDPNGPYRFATAGTQNMSQISIDARNVNAFAFVSGSGSVFAGIANGGSYAQGSGNFNYTGQFSGNGNAETFNSVNVGPNGSHVFSSSSAHSAGSGGFDY